MEKRYLRNMDSLSANEIELLHTKKVCVVGCGGLGGYVIEMLARIGILHITAVDGDVFEESNLNRQLFSAENILGKPKVFAARERIEAVNSSVSFNALYCTVKQDNAESIIQNHDVVIDALDNIGTRLIIQAACHRLNIPLVHGSIGGWYGQVATIMPGDNLLNKLYGANAEKGAEIKLGNLPFTAGVVASYECAEVIKLLTGKGDILRNSFLNIDLLNNDFNIIALL